MILADGRDAYQPHKREQSAMSLPYSKEQTSIE